MAAAVVAKLCVLVNDQDRPRIGRPSNQRPSAFDARHFDRWLALFNDTAREVCPPAAAEHFIERAHRVAESLELGIAGQHRVLLMKGERLRRPDADVFLPRV